MALLRRGRDLRPRGTSQTRARSELIAQVSAPLRSYLVTESGSAGVLLGATVLALVCANSPVSSFYEDLWGTRLAVRLGDATLSMDLHGWINDAVMALFFFVIGLEVRREFSVGELRDRRGATIPVLAGLAGMAVPAVLFLAVNSSGPARGGWGVVIGTDTAFLLGALALVGPRFSTQLRIFLLTLSVIDDIVAVSVIGIVYSDHVRPAPLAGAAACLAGIWLMSRRHVWRSSPFVVVGILLWFLTVEGGLHAATAGMAAGLLVAARAPERRDVEGAARGFRAFRQSPLPTVARDARRRLDRAVSVNERLQEALHPWTSFLVVPVFAFANAGVDLRHGVLAAALGSALTWGVCLALVVGKPVGIAAATAWGREPGSDGSLPESRPATCSAGLPCPASGSPCPCSSPSSRSTTAVSGRRRRLACSSRWSSPRPWAGSASGWARGSGTRATPTCPGFSTGRWTSASTTSAALSTHP